MASFVWVIVLTIIASVASLTPDLLPSLPARLAVAGAIVFCGIGAIVAMWRERKAGDEREREMERRLTEKVETNTERIIAEFRIYREATEAASKLPPGTQQRHELEERARISAATIEALVTIPAGSPFQLSPPDQQLNPHVASYIRAVEDSE